MLLQDGAHGYLHRSERNLCSADLFVFRELETTCLEILVRAKTILVMMSRTKNMWRIAHMSGVAKSTRERCIRVAAIVIVITVGIWNCCALNDSKYATMTGRADIRNEVQLNGRSSSVDGREETLPVKSKIADT